MAKTDGNVHTAEIELINNLTNNEIEISLADISEVEKKLKLQIAEYSCENV